MADLFRGLITDEGINKARDIVTTQGWKIAPYQFSFTSAPKGEFSTTRTTASMQSTWYTGYFSTVDKIDNNKILLTISLDGNESGVARDITEIYITASSSGGATPFLYSLIQPIATIVFQPSVGMELSFILTLTNTNKADIYTIEYVDSSKLGNYQLKKEKGQPNGYAPLGTDGIIPDNHLPLRDNLPLGTVVPILCPAGYIPSGYLPCNGLEYTYNQFTSFYDDYLLKGLVATCTYQEYQADINTYGSCSKFALDTVKGTFKVPQIANGGVIRQAMTDGELNKIYQAGLGGAGTSVALRYFVIVTHGLINTSITNWATWINTLHILDSAINIGRPVISLSNTLPEGFIFLEGGIVSRTTYSNLYSIYGTTYGAGDGSTTFQLPDFRNRAIWGSTTFGYLEAGLPDHSHTYNINNSFTLASGYGGSGHVLPPTSSWTGKASASNSIYGKSDTVQPPSIKVRVITRYK